MGKGGKGVGVEHASPEAICLAIKATHTLTEEVKEVITKKSCSMRGSSVECMPQGGGRNLVSCLKLVTRTVSSFIND